MTAAGVRVALFAPFFSGVVLAASGAGPSAAWDAELARRAGDGWRLPTDSFRLQGYSQVLEGPVRGFIPQFAAERRIEAAPSDPLAAVLGTPSVVRIALSDYGTGILVALYEGPAPQELPDPGSLRAQLQEAYGAAVEAAIAEFRALAGAVGRIDPNEQVLDDGTASSFLWVHELFALEAPARQVRKAAAAIVDDGAPCVVDGGVVSFGNGVSALVARARSTTNEETVVRVIALQTAYWAAATRLDLLLVRRLAALSPGSSANSLRRIERDGEELLVLFHHVRFFRTAISGLGGYVEPDDWAIWSTLADRWGLTGKLDALDAKLDTLRQLGSSLHEGAQARRDRMLSTILFVFTVITGVAVVFTLVDFLENQAGFSDPRAWRLAVAAAAAGIGGLILVVGALLLRGVRRAPAR